MSEDEIGAGRDGVEQEYDFTEPPQKVWRAISIPEFREGWLPEAALAAPEPVSVTPEREISYRMREDAPPHLESTVTFRIAPNGRGGTSLRIVHEPTDVRFGQATTVAANSNSSPLMLAA